MAELVGDHAGDLMGCWPWRAGVEQNTLPPAAQKHWARARQHRRLHRQIEAGGIAQLRDQLGEGLLACRTGAPCRQISLTCCSATSPIRRRRRPAPAAPGGRRRAACRRHHQHDRCDGGERPADILTTPLRPRWCWSRLTARDVSSAASAGRGFPAAPAARSGRQRAACPAHCRHGEDRQAATLPDLAVDIERASIGRTSEASVATWRRLDAPSKYTASAPVMAQNPATSRPSVPSPTAPASCPRRRVGCGGNVGDHGSRQHPRPDVARGPKGGPRRSATAPAPGSRQRRPAADGLHDAAGAPPTPRR